MKPIRFDTPNGAYVQALFDQYLQNPSAVDETWRRYFEEGGATGLLGAESIRAGAAAPTVAQLRAARAFGELVDALRLHGHRAAHLDPLGSTPRGHPMLDPEFHGATAEELSAVPTDFMGLGERGQTVGEVLDFLRLTYTGTIGYEFEHLEDPEAREWLRVQIESGAHRQPLSAEEQRRLLARLTEVEVFEQFLHKSYLGAKRFSIEGLDLMVPMLDLAVEHEAADGAREVVIGMAHRGRLNVLAHVLGVPYAKLLAKFEGKHAHTGGTGDVKYHLGAEGTYATASGEPLSVVLAPNPSHLEFIDAVVCGMARARQTDRTSPQLRRNESSVLAIQIHGDAAFSGQGVVPETLNLSQLAGYRIGGSLHIIANNQVGFTTDPDDGRSADYASDVARGFDIPIFHVNADDAEACLAVARLALAYRDRFHADVVVDLIGYRRFGHNEADEPAYTQPVMYQIIAEHPTVRMIWADQLIQEGVVSAQDVEQLWRQKYDQLLEVQGEVKASGSATNGEHEQLPVQPQESAAAQPVQTRVPAETLLGLDAELHSWPADFTVNPKLARQLEKRSRILADNGGIDWAHAEALSFASLLTQGAPIRMSGQDTQRGTFSQRHLVLHDVKTGRSYAPIQHLKGSRAPFEIYNSPLSELAVMGFEYGYSVVASESLVLWEAQFGDFGNGAQVIIDQFISAGRAKWDQHSRLVLLLPHGHEGQGPEHSSARLERFLQLGGEENMGVANCTTPAQYFHILRRQALLVTDRPLIMMTPKSLLRHPKATSRLTELADRAFHPVLDDAAAQPADVQRVVLCTGKIYYDLAARREKETGAATALVRIEELYPFPADELRAVLEKYPEASEIVWCQEEPENMGAWRYVALRLPPLLTEELALTYCGRPERASPAEGYAGDHEAEQNRIVTQALTVSSQSRTARKP